MEAQHMDARPMNHVKQIAPARCAADTLANAGAAATLMLAALCALLAGCATAPERFAYSRVIMGAPCTLTLYASNRAHADEAARAAFARLCQVEESLSDWIATSETRRLPSTAGASVAISRDLLRVLERSREFWLASDGAFDPTVAPVVALWRSARAEGATGAPPSDASIASARARVGFEHVQFTGGDSPRYWCALDGVRLDFGGIGQGYGADAALEVLANHGVAAALIDLSGDIAASGAPPHSPKGWRVALRNESILLRHAALTTSGDAFQHMDVAAGAAGAPGAPGITRYSHIIDPRTGKALTTRTAVTVIAPNAVDADALATALSVLGPSAGMAMLAAYPRAAAELVVEQPGAEQTIVHSPNWPGTAEVEARAASRAP